MVRSVKVSWPASPTLSDDEPKELIRIMLTIATAHGHVRTQAGLFDVSHMLQHVFTGKSSLEFLSSLCPSSLTSLAPWSSTLSVLLNEEGGIIDDMIVTKHGEDGQGGQRFYVVTNAGRAEEDVAWITKKLEEWNSSEGKGKGKEVKWEKLEGYGLVALQGAIRPTST
jgi:aminomethyltransferase